MAATGPVAFAQSSMRAASPASEYLGDDVLAVQRETRAQRKRIPGRVRLRDEGRGLVALEAEHPDGPRATRPALPLR